MTSEIKKQQLQILLSEFELIAKTTLTQLQILGKLMRNNDIQSLIDEAEANEIVIDRLEVKIREEVIFSIFKFNPVAEDLRRIIAYQDITTNLERVGDMILNIIHYINANDFSAPELAPAHRRLNEMLETVNQMLRNAISSFANRNYAAAVEVIAADDTLDEMFHLMKTELQEMFVDRALSRDDIRCLLALSAISHNLERCGDSATNIAEATAFLTEGKDIRHQTAN
ncbi:MAG: hypothetical protein LBB41_03245 [Prevotellaceae bacterium]|jgi:phosphate transport system protein|nr:hypothetical protein [Prevotellaceae bacterium]